MLLELARESPFSQHLGLRPESAVMHGPAVDLGVRLHSAEEAVRGRLGIAVCAEPLLEGRDIGRDRHSSLGLLHIYFRVDLIYLLLEPLDLLSELLQGVIALNLLHLVRHFVVLEEAGLLGDCDGCPELSLHMCEQGAEVRTQGGNTLV